MAVCPTPGNTTSICVTSATVWVSSTSSFSHLPPSLPLSLPQVTPDGRLPDAKQGHEHLRDIFYRMGFVDKEIVALSGAHALGRAHPDRSGFDGPWTKEPLIFDNSYFTVRALCLDLPPSLPPFRPCSNEDPYHMAKWVKAYTTNSCPNKTSFL